MLFFKGRTSDEVWRAAAAAIPATPNQMSRAGSTRKLVHVTFEVEEPVQRWITSREPAMNPAFAIAEVLWILSGRQDAEFLTFWNPQYPKFAGPGPNYHGAYGYRLRHAFGVDQIERAYQVFQKKPESRQVVLQIWGADRDLPNDDGEPASQDIPCNVCSLLKVRDGALHWTQIMRSNDLFRGLPHNFIQFTVMQEVLAGWLGLRVGPYHHWSDSLHVYEDAAEGFSVGALKGDTQASLYFTRSEWNEQFSKVCECAERLTSPELTESDVLHSLEATGMGRWRPYVSLLCSDAARRHHWTATVRRSLEACEDLVLRDLGCRWIDSKASIGDR